MKKQYTSPELEILCLAPAEQLASVIDFDNLIPGLDGNDGLDGASDPVSSNDLDIGFGI